MGVGGGGVIPKRNVSLVKILPIQPLKSQMFFLPNLKYQNLKHICPLPLL
jgi:hypothetical protein